MGMVLAAVLVVNLVVLVVVIHLALSRRGPGTDAGGVVREELRAAANQNRSDLAVQRGELQQSMTSVRDSIEQRLSTGSAEHRQFQNGVDVKFDAMRRENEERLDAMARRIQGLTERNTENHTELQKVLRAELDTLRRGNEEKLDKMREVVDEKLQGTLERRLGESFKLVSDRLEQVQKGLGEMQSLASDVGGLKRVLTNVKSRGTWGEVQLARQLEDVLSPDQYEANVVIKVGSRENVEFAVKLPGQNHGQTVYLPIDSKFPHEDYDRLLDAQELGEPELIATAEKNLQRAVVTQAKLISSKYISPPQSTDFAIMYLPTEGLFAEVIRIPGLVNQLQTQYRVVVSGPTLLATLLNSLQMGFRTLAIEKRSSEVWQVLGAAKTEFSKYGDVWERIGKQLQTVQNTVEAAGQRTRAVERKLRNVETLDVTGAGAEDVFEELLSDTDAELAPADAEDTDDAADITIV